jgi:hypothetical protein
LITTLDYILIFDFVKGFQESGKLCILLSFAIAVLSGAIGATIVGLAQWWAMHPWFPQIGRFLVALAE